MGAGCPVYGAPLMAREDNTGPQDGDSCHVALELTHPFANQISEAVETLGDPGVAADVARYRRVAKRRAELRMQEHDLDRRWADTSADVQQIVKRLRKARTWQWIQRFVISDQERPLPVQVRDNRRGLSFQPYYHDEERGRRCAPRDLTPAQRIDLSIQGSANDDRQWRHCRLCRRKGHRDDWCWTPHKYCPEDHCRVKSYHTYYARGDLCATTRRYLGQSLPEDQDDDWFNIEPRVED
jgi:hypothetical protein